MVTENTTQSDGSTSFLRAARAGNLDRVLEHLKNNIDINTSNANGLNALHLASKDGHVHVASELLRRGAIVDSATKKGNTALHIASLAGQEDIVKLLLQHNASVNVQSQNGFTPLYMAAQENHDTVVKLLLANGANQSLATEDGFTPLAVAMQQGHDKVVAVLLESDTRGKVRLPALHIAAKKDDVKAATLLLDNDHNPDVTSKSGFTPLHIASHYGNQSIANLLIQKGADVNFSAKHNISPLHVAAKWGKTNMVSLLLEKGANIEAKTRDGLTPLHCAARSGHEQVVDMLLERGAPISAKTKNGLAALHMAAQGEHVDAARILLYHRAPVDEVTIDYLTALHVAAHCGHVRVAKLLLDRNADANSRALNGFTPLHIACKKNRIKVVELLLRHGASIGATTESGLTPLHVAAFMGCMNIVIYLLQHDASPDVPTVRGETPLHLAARANQTDIIRILLRNGAQVDARAREQQTPLHIASRLGNVDIVMLLLQHGAQVDAITKDMYTALHISAKEGQDEVAAVLIDNGASLEATTKKGFTALHLAAKYGHAKVAQLLLQKEADVDAQGKNGVTPLHVACHYDKQNVALMLLDKGASPHAIAKNGHTPLHIAARKNQMDIATTLLEYGAQPNAESKAGFTPLHLSSQEGHIELSNLLIEHKASVNHPAKNGLTPTHLCAQEDNVDMADLLLRNGANIDMATKAGYTPLHIACHFGQANMARYLVQHGANVNAATAIGYTPLHQAAQQGHCHIVKLLLEKNANANALTTNGQTPLNIAQRLGYISVLDSLKSVTSTDEATQPSIEQKYRVVAPEAMHESFMSDSEDEGGDDNILPEQPYRYLTVDEMKSLGDDSLPIDVTRDERIDSNRMTQSTEFTIATQQILEGTATSPYKAYTTMKSMLNGTFQPDHEYDDKRYVSFLVSFLVDARGGAMRGRRHSGVRMIIPSRSTCQPTRITCRYVKPQRTMHPPQLMEGEALTSRILELGPVSTKFLTPVIIEVPHFASLRGKEREIIILRSDNGETWREHIIENSEELIHDILQQCFEPEEIAQMEQQSNNHVSRFVTYDFPQYFAIVSRIRQEVHAIGPEGGMVSSTVVPQVQAVFPQGALTKKIKVGLQAQPVDPDLAAKLLGRGVAVSPIVTVEPRRRKFHKAITLSMPAPKAHSQGMINQYSGNTPTLRLLCSITGGPSRAQWEDVTGSTPLTFVNDCVSFTTTVSARFWLMDCRNISEATKMATELYKEIIHVPFIAKFVVFAKRIESYEARLRVFCMTDDNEDKTLEKLEWFTEVAKSRNVEVLEGKPQYIEMAGNLVPITKSGEQLHLPFKAFRENRLPFTVRVKDQHADIVGRTLFMKEPKVVKGEPPQQPICILNIVLPEKVVPDSMTAFSDKIPTPFGIGYANCNRHQNDHYIGDIRIVDLSNLLGKDWIQLASELDISSEEIDEIIQLNSDSIARQAQNMIRLYKDKPNYDIGTLETALKNIGRDDIMNKCKNRHLSHSQEVYETAKTKNMEPIEKYIHEQNNEIRQLNESEEVKYSAEEKEVGDSESEDESVKRTVAERRDKIVKRLSMERQIPASSQKRELTREIIEIKRKSLIEDKKAMHESEIYMQLPADNSVKSSSILSEQVIKMKIGKTDINQIHKNGTDKEFVDKLKYSKAEERVDVSDNTKIEDLKAKDITAIIPKPMLEEISESKKEMLTTFDQVNKDKVSKEMTKTVIATKIDNEKVISKISESLPQDSNGIKDKIKMFSQHEIDSAKRSKIDKESSKTKVSPPSKAAKDLVSSNMRKTEDLAIAEQSLKEDLKSVESLSTSSIKHMSEDAPVIVQQITVIKKVISVPMKEHELPEVDLKPQPVESMVSLKKPLDTQIKTQISDETILSEIPSLSKDIISSQLQSETIEKDILHMDSFKLPQEELKAQPSKDDIIYEKVESKILIEAPPKIEESLKIKEESKPLQSEQIQIVQLPLKIMEESQPKEEKLISQTIKCETVTMDKKFDLKRESKVIREESTITEKRPNLKEVIEISKVMKSTDVPVTIQQIAPIDVGVLQKDLVKLKQREFEDNERNNAKEDTKIKLTKTLTKHEEESIISKTIPMERESKVTEEKETIVVEAKPVVKEFISEFDELKSSQLVTTLLEKAKSDKDKEVIQMKEPTKFVQETITTKSMPIKEEPKVLEQKEATIIEVDPIVKEFTKTSEDGKLLEFKDITTSQLSKNLLEEVKAKEIYEDIKFIQMEEPVKSVQKAITTKVIPIKEKAKVIEQKEATIIESAPIVKEVTKISEDGKPLEFKEVTSSELSKNLLQEIKTKEGHEDLKVMEMKTSVKSVHETITTKVIPSKEEAKVIEQKEATFIESAPIVKEVTKISEDGKPLEFKEVTSSELSKNLLQEIKTKEGHEDLKVMEMKTPVKSVHETITTKVIPSKEEAKVIEQKEATIIESAPIVKEVTKISEDGKPLEFKEVTSSELSKNLLQEIKTKEGQVMEMKTPVKSVHETITTKVIPSKEEAKVIEQKEATFIETAPVVKQVTKISKDGKPLEFKEITSSELSKNLLDEVKTKEGHEDLKVMEMKKPAKSVYETTTTMVIPSKEEAKVIEQKEATFIETPPVVKQVTKISKDGKPLEFKEITSSELSKNLLDEVKTKEGHEDLKVMEMKKPAKSVYETTTTMVIPSKEEAKVIEQKEATFIETPPVVKQVTKISKDCKPLEFKEITSSELSKNLLEEIKTKEGHEDLKVIEIKKPVKPVQETTTIKVTPIKEEAKVIEQKEAKIIEEAPVVKQFTKISEDGKLLDFKDITSLQLSKNLLKEIETTEDHEDLKVFQMETPMKLEQEIIITKTLPIKEEFKVIGEKKATVIEGSPVVKVFSQISKSNELIDVAPFPKELHISQLPSDVLEKTSKKQEDTKSLIETTPVVEDFFKISKESTPISKIPLFSSKPLQESKLIEEEILVPQIESKTIIGPVVKEFKIIETKYIKSSHLPIKIAKETKTEDDKYKMPLDKMTPKEETNTKQERKITESSDIKISEENKSKELESSQSSLSIDSQDERKLPESQELLQLEDKEVLHESAAVEISKDKNENISIKHDHSKHFLPLPKEEKTKEEIIENVFDDVRNEAKLFIDHILIDTMQIINEQQDPDKYFKSPNNFPNVTDKTHKTSSQYDDPKLIQSSYEVKHEELFDLSPKPLTIDATKFTKYQDHQQEPERSLDAANGRSDDDAILPTPKPRSIKSGSSTNLSKAVDETSISDSPVPKPRSQIKAMASYTNLAALEKQMDSLDSMDMPDVQPEQVESYESEAEEEDYPQKTSFYIGEPSQIITSSETLQQESKIQIQNHAPQKIDSASSLGSSPSTVSSIITIAKETKILPMEEQVIPQKLKGPDDEEPLVIIDQIELVKRIIPEIIEKAEKMEPCETKQVKEKESINLKQNEVAGKMISDKFEALGNLESDKKLAIVEPNDLSLSTLGQDSLDKKLISKTIDEMKKLDSKIDETIQEDAKSPDLIDTFYKTDLDASSSSSSYYKSFEKSASRPVSSEIISQMYSSEYQTAMDKETSEFLSAISSSEKTISSQDSIRSIDSHSDISVTSVSIDVSELSETLVGSTMDETQDITDPFEMSTKNDSKNEIWNIPDHNITENRRGSPVTLLRRSPEMTFKLKTEQKLSTGQEQEYKNQIDDQQFKEEREISLESTDHLKLKNIPLDDEDNREVNQMETEERQGIPIPSSQTKDSSISKTLPDEAKYASSLSEGSVLSLSVSSTSNMETVIENIENPLLQSIDTSSLSGLGCSFSYTDEFEGTQNIRTEDEDGEKAKINLQDEYKEIEPDEYDRYETEYSRQFRSPKDIMEKRKISSKTYERVLDVKDDSFPSNLKSSSSSKDSLMEEMQVLPVTESFSDQHYKTPTKTLETTTQFTKESKTDEVKLSEHITQDTIKSKKILEEEEFFQRIVQEEYKQKLAKLQDPDFKDSSSDERKAADSPDSFEMVEQPDISDEFIIIEEVAKEANEDELGGKSIRIKQIKYEGKHDEEVEKIIIKSAPADPKLGSQIYKDEMNFEFEESPPTGGGGDESSNGESKENDTNSKEDSIAMNRRWVEMQLTDNQLRYPYELTGAVLEDIKEEDAEFEVGSSRINSFKESFSSTPDGDAMAARRHHPRGEHDDISMNSLQEFESLEQAISLENRTRNYQGSTDSSSGSFTRRYIARHTNSAGHGDDVISLSSLKEFEGLENACIEAHLIEIKAKEEAALLSRSEESNTSTSNEDITKSKTLSPPNTEVKTAQDLIKLDPVEPSPTTTSTEITTITTTTINSGKSSETMTRDVTETSKVTKSLDDDLMNFKSRETSSTTTTLVTTSTTITTTVKNAASMVADKSGDKTSDLKEN